MKKLSAIQVIEFIGSHQDIETVKLRNGNANDGFTLFTPIVACQHISFDEHNQYAIFKNGSILFVYPS